MMSEEEIVGTDEEMEVDEEGMKVKEVGQRGRGGGGCEREKRG